MSFRDRRGTCVEINMNQSKVKVQDPWQEFSNHIVNITVTPVDFQSKPLSNSYSSDFKSILIDMMNENKRKHELEQQMQQNLPSRKEDTVQHRPEVVVDHRLDHVHHNPVVNIRSVEVPVEDIISDDPVIKEAPIVSEVIEPLKEWKLMKKGIMEQHDQQIKKSPWTIGWDTVKYGLNDMADAESSRQRLYCRYLYNPNPDAWAVGLINKPEFLIERARRSAKNQNKRRPMTCIAAPVSCTSSNLVSAMRGPSSARVKTASPATRCRPNRPTTSSKERPAYGELPRTNDSDPRRMQTGGGRRTGYVDQSATATRKTTASRDRSQPPTSDNRSRSRNKSGKEKCSPGDVSDSAISWG